MHRLSQIFEKEIKFSNDKIFAIFLFYMIRKTSSPQASKANSSLKSFLAFILQCWHTAWKLFCIEKKSLQNLTFQPLIGGKLWNNTLDSMQRYVRVKMILFGHINQFRVCLWFANNQINFMTFDGEKFLGQTFWVDVILEGHFSHLTKGIG